MRPISASALASLAAALLAAPALAETDASALIAAEGQGTMDAALAELASVWGEGPRRVMMPLHVRVARLGQRPGPLKG